MLLEEAKEILEKNGYRLDEAALTMRSLNKTLNKLFGPDYNVVADDSPRKCYVQYYDFDTGIYVTGDLRVDRLSDLSLEDWIEETKKVAEKVKKSKIKRIGEASEGPKVTDLKDKILNVLKNSAEGLTLKEIAKELQLPFVNARLTYSAGSLVDDDLVTYNEKTNKWTVAENLETNNDYDVETLFKMWIEQNKPVGENIDYREHDDGSISIFEVIYDPHDCGDDWDQEWDYLADFENIDELKAAVGV